MFPKYRPLVVVLSLLVTLALARSASHPAAPPTRPQRLRKPPPPRNPPTASFPCSSWRTAARPTPRSPSPSPGRDATLFFTPTGVTYRAGRTARRPLTRSTAGPPHAQPARTPCRATPRRASAGPSSSTSLTPTPNVRPVGPGPRRDHRLLLPRPARGVAHRATHLPARGLPRPVARHRPGLLSGLTAL